MKSFYLVRHGDIGLEKVCIGNSNLPLSVLGKQQCADNLDFLLSLPDMIVYSSPLERCLESLDCIGIKRENAHILPELSEICMGAWDGLPFSTIKQNWPELYEKRGQYPASVAAPDGESFEHCKIRAQSALDKIYTGTRANTYLLFLHSGVGKMVMSCLCDESIEKALKHPFPYAGVIQILQLNNGNCISFLNMEHKPLNAFPSDSECQSVYNYFQTPVNVVNHCRSVAELGVKICEKLNREGFSLNNDFVYRACLLHDAAKCSPHHAEVAARYLLSMGYGALASAIGDHMWLEPKDERVCEKAIIFLADKLVQGTQRVSLEERYSTDCSTEKLPFVQSHFNQAKRVNKILFDVDKLI